MNLEISSLPRVAPSTRVPKNSFLSRPYLFNRYAHVTIVARRPIPRTETGYDWRRALSQSVIDIFIDRILQIRYRCMWLPRGQEVLKVNGSIWPVVFSHRTTRSKERRIAKETVMKREQCAEITLRISDMRGMHFETLALFDIPSDVSVSLMCRCYAHTVFCSFMNLIRVLLKPSRVVVDIRFEGRFRVCEEVSRLTEFSFEIKNYNDC